MGVHVNDKPTSQGDGAKPQGAGERRVRADAQRNLDTLLQAAKAVFATSGVDAPVREIAEKAGVGIGTVYRHFPQRADLIAAVFRREIDACADAAPILAAEYAPFEALARWMQRYRGLHRHQTRACHGAAFGRSGVRLCCPAISISDSIPHCGDCLKQRSPPVRPHRCRA